MSILLILFFSSLAGILIMMGRKLFLLQKGEIIIEEKITFEIPHLEKVKHLTVTNIKKYGQTGLVTAVRSYLVSTNFLKNKYREVKSKIKNIINKNNINNEKKEISKFLKIIGDYKNKIREIKHKIKKEENL